MNMILKNTQKWHLRNKETDRIEVKTNEIDRKNIKLSTAFIEIEYLLMRERLKLEANKIRAYDGFTTCNNKQRIAIKMLRHGKNI